MEKEMTTHSSVLVWRIPGMGEHGGLPSMGSHRVGHDWSNLAAAAAELKSFKCGMSCQSRFDTGCLGLVHWDDPGGWYGEGGGSRVQDGEHIYTCGGFI